MKLVTETVYVWQKSTTFNTLHSQLYHAGSTGMLAGYDYYLLKLMKLQILVLHRLPFMIVSLNLFFCLTFQHILTSYNELCHFALFDSSSQPFSFCF